MRLAPRFPLPLHLLLQLKYLVPKACHHEVDCLVAGVVSQLQALSHLAQLPAYLRLSGLRVVFETGPNHLHRLTLDSLVLLLHKLRQFFSGKLELTHLLSDFPTRLLLHFSYSQFLPLSRSLDPPSQQPDLLLKASHLCVHPLHQSPLLLKPTLQPSLHFHQSLLHPPTTRLLGQLGLGLRVRLGRLASSKPVDLPEHLLELTDLFLIGGLFEGDRHLYVQKCEQAVKS